MLYTKITASDGSVISAEAIENPIYVKSQPNGIFIRCSSVAAQGVVSKNGAQTYQLAGRPALPGEHLTAEEISQADYDQLIIDLDPDEGDDETPDPAQDDPDSDVMTPEVMRLKLIQLEEDLQREKGRTDRLEGAMLEVGEILLNE